LTATGRPFVDVEARAFKLFFMQLQNQMAVIPMPHSRIFETGSQFQAH
jgi:hypothetical protein